MMRWSGAHRVIPHQAFHGDGDRGGAAGAVALCFSAVWLSRMVADADAGRDLRPSAYVARLIPNGRSAA